MLMLRNYSVGPADAGRMLSEVALHKPWGVLSALDIATVFFSLLAASEFVSTVNCICLFNTSTEPGG